MSLKGDVLSPAFASSSKNSSDPKTVAHHLDFGIPQLQIFLAAGKAPATLHLKGHAGDDQGHPSHHAERPLKQVPRVSGN